MAFTTREHWTNFQPYSLERRGSRNIPLIFLKEACWREYRDDEGYFVDFTAAPTHYRPVEFNFDHLCWVEVTWNPVDHRWDVVRPAGPNYHCNINIRDIPTDRNSWGCIDGQTKESESESQTPEESENEQSLVQQAESLRIQEPETINVLSPATNMATATYTTEQLAQMAQEEARRIREETTQPSPEQLAPTNQTHHLGDVAFRPEPHVTSADSCSTAEQYRAEWVAATRSEGIDPAGVLYYEHDPDWQAPWK
ncbi:hypothetical protein EDB87DRAFT_1577340 [Lactarius vividus]|nr:hypothetical protein EDB87DRAFT_1577340 [Lactarius vividus]